MKWIGIFMLAGTLVFVGVKEANRFKKNMLFWQEMEKLANYFVTELRFTCDEPTKILQRYLLGNGIKEQGGEHSLEQLFSFLMTYCNQEENWFSNQTVQLFFSGLGISDLEGQLAHCGRFQRMFEMRSKEAVQAYTVQGVLRRKLWALAAVATTILFL